jgi:hypothetical protein
MDLEHRKKDYECIYSETFILRFLGLLKSKNKARHQWLTPIILTTWETEIGRITV